MINEFDLNDWEMLSEPLPLKQVKNGTLFKLDNVPFTRVFLKKGNASCWTNCFPCFEVGKENIWSVKNSCKLHYPWDTMVLAYKKKELSND